MISFLSFANFDLVLEYLGGDSLVSLLQKKAKLNYNQVKISSWSQIFELCSQEEDIFGEKTLPDGLLLDFQDLKLTPDIAEELTKLKTDTKIYLYSGSFEDVFTAEIKKTIKKHFEFVELKKNNTLVERQIFEDYCKVLNLKFKSTSSILNQGFASYGEIIDILDFCAVSLDPNVALSSFVLGNEKPLFMETFNISNSYKEAQKWHKLIKEEELQLAISLLFTKIGKQKDSQKYMQKIILLDQNLKTKNGGQMLWWKLFLWEMKKISN